MVLIFILGYEQSNVLNDYLAVDMICVSTTENTKESIMEHIENMIPAGDLANPANPCLDREQYMKDHMMVDDVMSSVSARTEALANASSTFKLRGRGRPPPHGNA